MSNDLASLAGVLDRAAETIDRNGWMQGNFYDFTQAQVWGKPPSECRVCAYGAIHIALTGRPQPPEEDGPDPDEAAYAVLEFIGIEGHDLASWNDQVDRTAEEVAQAMRDTAADLRKQVAS